MNNKYPKAQKVVWRWGRAYPDNPRIRSIPKSDFPNSPADRRRRAKEMREVEKALSKTFAALLMIIFFELLAVGLFFLIILAVCGLIFGLSYIFRISYRYIYSKIKKQEINKDVFKTTEFEKKCIGGIRKSFDFLKRGLSSVGRHYDTGVRNLDKNHKSNNNYNNFDNGRYCEVCGGRLGRGRVRYCSQCKPTGKSSPFWN